MSADSALEKTTKQVEQLGGWRVARKRAAVCGVIEALPGGAAGGFVLDEVCWGISSHV